MMIVREDRADASSASGMRCPTCGALGSLRGHGSYERHLVEPVRGAGGGVVGAREATLTVARVRCAKCGVTHALLPAGVVPYSPFSVAVCLWVTIWCLRAERGPREAARAFHASLEACRRIRGEAARLARTLSCALSELAERLEEAARDASRLALDFVRQHGTAPFSRVALPKWPPPRDPP